MYDSNKEWQVTMNWGVVFSNETQVFEGANATLLDLVGYSSYHLNDYAYCNIEKLQKH